MKNILIGFFVLFSSFLFSQSCTHTIKRTDTFGDGWNGGTVAVSVNGVTVLSNLSCVGLGPTNSTFTASVGSTIRVYRTLAGSYPSEMRIQVLNGAGSIIINTIQPVAGTATTGGQTVLGSCAAVAAGPCTNTSSYGSATAPSTPTTVTISTCQYQTEYNTIYSCIAGQTYQSYYNLGGYITVRSGTYNGTVVTSGNSPLNWVCPSSGTYFVHYNTNNTCGTAMGCGTSSISCLTCLAPPPPSNDLVCNSTPITCGQTLSGTTVNATNSGTGENGLCSVSQTQPGVWYVISGNGQIMTANLCATAWDSKMSVFSGPNCSTLSCVGGNDDFGPACSSSSASFSWTSSIGTNYYILVHGYSASSSFSIGLTCISPPPADPTSISATQNTICNGSSTTLTANGAVGVVYWYIGGCASTFVSTGNSISVSPASTTTYYARNLNGGLFSSGCASTTITVNPNPTVTISAATNTICNGSNTQLISNISGVSSPGNLVVTISTSGFLDESSWTLTNSLGTVIGSGGPYGLGSTNIIPIGSSANDPYTFNVETQGIWNDNTANYLVTCNGTTVLSGSLVGGQSITQSISSCGSSPGVTYLWTPSNGLTNASAPSPFASPTTTQTYQLTATANGCSASTSTTITVNPSVGFVSTISGNNTIIAGTQESYSITPVANSNYQWAYTESVTAPLWINVPNSNSPSITFTWPQTTTNGSARVIISNAYGCGTQTRFFNIVTNGALPVELLSFVGVCDNNLISLTWKTASEHNSDYFEVLKSRDGINWSILATLNSAGNSTEELTYTTKDENAIDGNNYYKLLQYDIDGQSKEYGPINVTCNKNTKGYFSIFPNPSSGSFQVVLNNKNMVGDGKLIIKDTKGSEILNKEINIVSGINLYNIIDLNVVDGIYYVQVSNGNFSTQVIKQIIK